MLTDLRNDERGTRTACCARRQRGTSPPGPDAWRAPFSAAFAAVLVIVRALPMAVTLLGVANAQDRESYLGEPVHYERESTEQPVARLAAALAAGTVTLARDEIAGLLPAVLDALDVLPASQTLVFSKTSFQNALIGPRTPRAIYFGDEVYVGAVPGSPVLELTAMDPQLGPIFYTLTDRGEEPPRIVRRDAECLRCHALSWTKDWPGHLVRSVAVDADGHPIQRLGAKLTTGESPFEERWGGWYVSGTHGDALHRGNATHADDADSAPPLAQAQNVVDLRGRIDAARYLSPHSDLVALMVLEHQTHAHNALAWAAGRTKLVLHRDRALPQSTAAEAGAAAPELSDSARSQLKAIADDLLAVLLLRDMPPLPAPVRGSSDFAGAYLAAGRRDRAGRSLRELELHTRLFRWPVSPMIASPSFRHLPSELREIVLLRMLRILTGRNGRRAYSHIADEDRQPLLAMLVELVPDLPADWHAAVDR
jgi:hypothetical protein